jgi:hypothetical protein
MRNVRTNRAPTSLAAHGEGGAERRPSPRWSSALLVATWLSCGASGGCLRGSFAKSDPQPTTNASTQAVLDLVTAERLARHLPPPSVVPELRPPALKGMVGVARGDASLATAAHAAALRAVQELGRHSWTFATDCTDLGKLQLPALALASRELLMNAAAVAGRDGHVYVLIILTEPGASSIRAEQLGGGGGTNPTLESYVHPVVAAGPCGERWPAPKRSDG